MKSGRATFKGNKLCFDDIGWALVKEMAKKLRMSPRKVVLNALKASIRLGYFNEKSKNA